MSKAILFLRKARKQETFDTTFLFTQNSKIRPRSKILPVLGT